MILFLNGTSSSGKSSLAKALQDLWPGPLMHVGFDAFVDMFANRFVGSDDCARDMFWLEQNHESSTDQPTVTRILQGPAGRRLRYGMAQATLALAHSGFDLVVDEVLFDENDLSLYVSALSPFTVHFIGIKCPIDVLEVREVERGNRLQGEARWQVSRVHPEGRTYDLEIDTSSDCPAGLARTLVEFVLAHPHPQAFAKSSLG